MGVVFLGFVMTWGVTILGKSNNRTIPEIRGLHYHYCVYMKPALFILFDQRRWRHSCDHIFLINVSLENAKPLFLKNIYFVENKKRPKLILLFTKNKTQLFRLHFFFKVIANRNCRKKDSQKVYDLYMNIYKQTTKLIKTISSGKIFQETCLRHRNVFTDFRTWETDCKVIPVGCFSYGIVFSIRIQMRVRIRG